VPAASLLVYTPPAISREGKVILKRHYVCL
jgi:hypothetical protein